MGCLHTRAELQVWKARPRGPRGSSCCRLRSRVPCTGKARCPHVPGADPRSPVPSRAAASAGDARPPGWGGLEAHSLPPAPTRGPGHRRARGLSVTQSCPGTLPLPAPAGNRQGLTGALCRPPTTPAVAWSPAQAGAQHGDPPPPPRILHASAQAPPVSKTFPPPPGAQVSLQAQRDLRTSTRKYMSP